MSDIKYYVIDVEGGDVNKTVSSIVEHQNVDADDIEVIKGSLVDVFQIPQGNAYKDAALVVLSCSSLTSYVDVDSYVLPAAAMIKSLSNCVFILNCEHAVYRNNISQKSKAEKLLGFNLVSTSLWRNAHQLDAVSVCDASEPEPAPEPEPSDFEVETWVPQDESTEEDDV